MSLNLTLNDRLQGLLIGTAVGDSVGLPAEKISRLRNHKLFQGQWEQKFVGSCGMLSDDTEHTIFVAQCLIASGNSLPIFQHRLAWCLKWWLLSFPAGIGSATLRSIIRLWLGYSPVVSGVKSAGNGAAMRSAIIGAYFAHQEHCLNEFVTASTYMTHRDPRALIGALAIAYLSGYIIREDLNQRPPLADIEVLLKSIDKSDQEWVIKVEQMIASWKSNLSVAEFVSRIGQQKGISGYVYHSVMMAIYSWYYHFDNFRDCLEAVYNCGGDTDTVGAIAGALSGVTLGVANIPQSWQNRMIDYPRNLNLLHAIAKKLTDNIQNQFCSHKPVQYAWWWVIPRNILFLLIVIVHGFRRLFPPY